MPNYDFISNKLFRESLESDSREMSICVDQGAWKAAQVAAGSIVEALLIDYLESHPNPARKLKKASALHLDLAEAVEICVAERVITQTTADLCSVVRAYRNLIHPGRVIRTGEQPPSRGSAVIALQLVELITNEIARELQKRVGLTAEQIASKVDRDSGAVKVLTHLLEKFDENQRRRLLVEIFPKSHYANEIESSDPENEEKASRIREAHHVVFEGATEETKRAYLREFVRIIKEEDGGKVRSTTLALFRAPYLNFVEDAQKALVQENLLHMLPKIHTSIKTMLPLKGMEDVITLERVDDYLDPLIRAMGAAGAKPWVVHRAQDLITDAAWLSARREIGIAVDKRLETWEGTYRGNGEGAKADAIRSMRGGVSF